MGAKGGLGTTTVALNLAISLNALAREKKVVMEGRDIGTVVFPNAERKFYLDADFDERIRRRHKQLAQQGKKVPISQIEKEERVRDHKDMNREIAPLKKAQNAICIDTTHMTIEKVVERIIEYIDIDRGA